MEENKIADNRQKSEGELKIDNEIDSCNNEIKFIDNEIFNSSKELNDIDNLYDDALKFRNDMARRANLIKTSVVSKENSMIADDIEASCNRSYIIKKQLYEDRESSIKKNINGLYEKKDELNKKLKEMLDEKNKKK